MRSAASLHRVASMSTATKSKSSSRAIAPKVSKVVKKTVKSVAKHGVMTQKQKIFCDEYLIDLNATQAAIRAGYSQKTAQEHHHSRIYGCGGALARLVSGNPPKRIATP